MSLRANCREAVNLALIGNNAFSILVTPVENAATAMIEVFRGSYCAITNNSLYSYSIYGFCRGSIQPYDLSTDSRSGRTDMKGPRQ